MRTEYWNLEDNRRGQRERAAHGNLNTERSRKQHHNSGAEVPGKRCSLHRWLQRAPAKGSPVFRGPASPVGAVKRKGLDRLAEALRFETCAPSRSAMVPDTGRIQSGVRAERLGAPKAISGDCSGSAGAAVSMHMNAKAGATSTSTTQAVQFHAPLR